MGENLLAWSNPWFCLAFETDEMLYAMGFNSSYWKVTSSFNLIASAVVISYSVRKIRNISLRHNKTVEKAACSTLPSQDPHHGPTETKPLRSVGSYPVIWKEMVSPLLGGYRNLVVTFTAVFATLLVIAYILCFFVDIQALVSAEFHITSTCVLMIIGMFFTIVISASSITSEKESGCWPLLLSTALEDRRIVIRSNPRVSEHKTHCRHVCEQFGIYTTQTFLAHALRHQAGDDFVGSHNFIVTAVCLAGNGRTTCIEQSGDNQRVLRPGSPNVF